MIEKMAEQFIFRAQTGAGERFNRCGTKIQLLLGRDVFSVQSISDFLPGAIVEGDVGGFQVGDDPLGGFVAVPIG